MRESPAVDASRKEAERRRRGSTVTVRPNEDLVLEYERVLHRDSETAIRVRAAAGRTAPLVVRLGQDYLATMRLVEISPSPQQATLESGVFSATFQEASEVRFTLLPRGVGRHTGWIVLDDLPPLHLEQRVRP